MALPNMQASDPNGNKSLDGNRPAIAKAALETAQVYAVPRSGGRQLASVYRSHSKALLTAVVAGLLLLGGGAYGLTKAHTKQPPHTAPQQASSVTLPDPATQLLTINSDLKVPRQAHIGTLNVGADTDIGGNLSVKGAVTMGQGLQVDGNGAFTGTLSAANLSTTSLQVVGNGNFTGSLSVNGIIGSSISITGNSNFSGNVSIAGALQGMKFNAGKYSVNGIDGAVLTCSSGQVLTSAVINGGIVTGGSCGSGSAALPGDVAYTDTNNIFSGTNNFTGALQHNGNDICDASGNCTVAGTAGGDLAGSYPNPTIASLQGGTLTLSSPASGNYLRYNGTGWVNQNLLAGDLPGGSGSYIQNGTSVQTSASFFIQPIAGNVGATIKANGADILSLQDASGNVAMHVMASGYVYGSAATGTLNLGGSTSTQFTLSDSAALPAAGAITLLANQVGFQVKNMNASPTADLLQLQNASGIVTRFDNGGNLTVPNVTVASQGTIAMVGGTTAQRPASPTEGQLYYDSTTHTLLTYNGSKWISDKTTATKVVAMGTTTGCTGTSPVASSNPDGADYVVTSCTSAQTTINAAIAALPAGGGTVYLEEGTYITDGNINLPSNVTLAGSGSATLIKYYDNLSGNQSMIANAHPATGDTHITVTNLRLDGNISNNPQVVYGLRFTKVGSGSGSAGIMGAHVDKVWAENFSGDGIQFANSEFSSITNSTSSYNGGSGYGGIDLNSSSYITVSGNVLQYDWSQNVNIAGGGHHTITGNVMQGFTRAINLSSTSYNTVSGNTSSGTSYGVQMVTSNYNTFTGNTFESGDYGVYTIFGSNNLFSGNTISNNSQGGMYMLGMPNTTISGNRFDNNGGAAAIDSIHLDVLSNTYCNNDFISGNDIADTAGTGYAIGIVAGTTGVYLSNNHLSGVGASSINDLGTGTIYNNQANGNGDIVLKSQSGGYAIGTSAASSSLSLQGGLRVTSLSSPAAPAVATAGTAGSASWGYEITALDGNGETIPSAQTTIATGNATLSATNYNVVSWSPVGGAYQYKVYRTTAGGTPNTTGLIATVNGNLTSYNDQGAAASGSVPTSNTTGGAYFQTGIGINTAPSINFLLNISAGNGVQGVNVVTTNSAALTAQSAGNNGVTGTTNAGNALIAGVLGQSSSSGTAVFGWGLGTGFGILGQSQSGTSAQFQTSNIGGTNTKATVIVKANTSQTADLLQLQSSGGSTLASFDASGNLAVSGLAAIGTSVSANFKLNINATGSVQGISVATGNGSAIIGQSLSNNGITGTTSGASLSMAAVFGQSSSTANAIYGNGMSSGIGILGQSQLGVSAQFQTGNTSGTNTKATVVVKANTSQTADLLQFQDANANVLATIGYQGNLTVKAATINGTLTVNGHIVSGNTSGTTTAAAGAAAGTGATVTITGNDTSGKIVITTGTSATAGDLADITFAGAYGSAPNVVLTAGDSQAALLQNFVSPTTTAFSINAAAGGSGLADGTTYTFYYHVIQ